MTLHGGHRAWQINLQCGGRYPDSRLAKALALSFVRATKSGKGCNVQTLPLHSATCHSISSGLALAVGIKPISMKASSPSANCGQWMTGAR